MNDILQIDTTVPSRGGNLVALTLISIELSQIHGPAFASSFILEHSDAIAAAKASIEARRAAFAGTPQFAPA